MNESKQTSSPAAHPNLRIPSPKRSTSPRTLATLLISASALTSHAAPRPPDIPFAPHLLDNGANEIAAAADINHDGQLDIVAGENWYEAPTWAKHHFRDFTYTEGYIDAFSDLPLDVDGDGWVDLVTAHYFGGKIVWYRNPGKAGGPWRETAIHSGARVEYAMLADLDNDGRANEVVAVEYGAGQAWYEVKAGTWVRHEISSAPTADHGIGVGDINQDGRSDLLTERGWYEAPADPRATGWAFHRDWESVNPPVTAGNAMQVGVLPGEKRASQAAPAKGPPPVARTDFMYVVDVNGDGRNDVVTSSAHDYGVFWLEQGAHGQWTRHMIDSAWSQAHASLFVDLNGDGKPDFVTGKRFLTHGDPGEREPLGVYWYEYRSGSAGAPAASGGIEWIRHIIDYGGRIGAGVQMAAGDLYGRGHLDLVVAGKSGLFLLENGSGK